MEKKDEIITRLEETLGEIRREDALWRLSPRSSEGKAAYEELKREAFRNTSRLYYLLDQATDKEAARRIEQEAYLYLSPYREPPDETPEGLINRTFVTNEPPAITRFQRICKWLSDIFNAAAALGDPTVAEKPVVSRGFLLLLDQPKSPRRGARLPLSDAVFTQYEQDLIEEALRGLYEAMLKWAQSLKGENKSDLANRILGADPQTYRLDGGLFHMVGNNRFGPFFFSDAIAKLTGPVDPRYRHILLSEYDGRYELLLEEAYCLCRLPPSEFVHEHLFNIVRLYLDKSVSGHFDRNVLLEPGFRVGVHALSEIWNEGLNRMLRISGAAEVFGGLREYIESCGLTVSLGVAFPERHKNALVEISKLLDLKGGKILNELLPALERILQEAFGTPAIPGLALKEEKFAAEAEKLNELLIKYNRPGPSEDISLMRVTHQTERQQAYQHFLNAVIGPEAEYVAEVEKSSTAKERFGGGQTASNAKPSKSLPCLRRLKEIIGQYYDRKSGKVTGGLLHCDEFKEVVGELEAKAWSNDYNVSREEAHEATMLWMDARLKLVDYIASLKRNDCLDKIKNALVNGKNHDFLKGFDTKDTETRPNEHLIKEFGFITLTLRDPFNEIPLAKKLRMPSTNEPKAKRIVRANMVEIGLTYIEREEKQGRKDVPAKEAAEYVYDKVREHPDEFIGGYPIPVTEVDVENDPLVHQINRKRRQRNKNRRKAKGAAKAQPKGKS